MNSQICIPLKSLAVKGQGESDVAPANGDTVDLTATGKVERTEGGNAYITLTTVNGQPLPADEPENPDAEGDAMRKQGEESDASMDFGG